MTDSQKRRRQSTEAPGKRALMDAAIRLAASSRCISSLGLRELAREAALNPNTFYRHFRNMDDLGLQLLREGNDRLRGPLRALRRQAAQQSIADNTTDSTQEAALRGRRVAQQTVKLYFDYVLEHRDSVVIAGRELHGPSELLRAELREQMNGFAEDMAADIQELGLAPSSISAARINQIAALLSRNLFHLSLDFIAEPERRDNILELAHEQIIMLFAGASVLQDKAG
ncbi:TetR/AcrR family transcriptional regulator [Pseudomonas neustonica]|uniref:TetR/AcrR family transcriptional regulator n=1 Tax=Pseudomonas neustonica TaxID=2487346 RepID=A0ABX9XFD5_9PSED|nr:MULTISPECIES: TetR/AcrR family transcriptional regulator [Pseudomonas]ROZ81402.1 TetR/AcrR family transcriptional regulator [Pseudomonas sp. SSM44]ROZ82676.1 TetR/AcrR family transcriptional regulator [Pseudomonas neustonica]|tara:strand:- start:139 stop:822 length:684 start_codon:yes stop_codon:yes gene_type:complete